MCTKATRNELSYCVDPFIYPRHAILHNIREHIFCLIPTSNEYIYILTHALGNEVTSVDGLVGFKGHTFNPAREEQRALDYCRVQ